MTDSSRSNKSIEERNICKASTNQKTDETGISRVSIKYLFQRENSIITIVGFCLLDKDTINEFQKEFNELKTMNL